jgi:hypothetical protein
MPILDKAAANFDAFESKQSVKRAAKQPNFNSLSVYADLLKKNYPALYGRQTLEIGDAFQSAKTLRIKNYYFPSIYAKLSAPKQELIVAEKPKETSEVKDTESKTPEFDKLPSKSSTPTMTYAGVGSRETPPEILTRMTKLAQYLDSKGYTLRSGAAAGADTAFELGATKKEIFPGSLKAGEREQKIAREIHPNPYALDNTKNLSFVWNLMARNTNQVFGKNLDTPADFLIAWTKDGLTKSEDRSAKSGGTGQAIDMASRKGIPVINMANEGWEQEIIALVEGKQPMEPLRLDLVELDINKLDPNNNQIDYSFSGVKILQSPEAIKMFEKGKKNNWDLNKILTELKIPSSQKELLLGLNTSNREELIVNMLSNYSYTIEINTATKTELDTVERYNEDTGEIELNPQEPEYDYEEIYDDEGNTIGLKPVLTEKGKRQLEEKPTQYYSNLTVPGGTNYVEKEIATPAITPAIHGHAAFSTKNGIGWFRSDDRLVQSKKEMDEDSKRQLTARNRLRSLEGQEPLTDLPTSKYISTTGKTTKVRRILELQSDLFQKSRNKKILTGLQSDFEAAEAAGMEVLRDSLPKENAFLQLLNKDNNWVTFFIKSIIQDSTKKGYEKVLFPTGTTASKIEGQTSIEDFKKTKQARIAELEEELDFIYEQQFEGVPNDTSGITKREAEIQQLRIEIERVELDSFDSLIPIQTFYENTVTNILKKQGYNPKLITDEYGNTWNELTLPVPLRKDVQQKNTLNFSNNLVSLQESDLALSELDQDLFKNKIQLCGL